MDLLCTCCLRESGTYKRGPAYHYAGPFRILGLYPYIPVHLHLNLLIHPPILIHPFEASFTLCLRIVLLVISAKAGYRTMEDPLPNSHHGPLG